MLSIEEQVWFPTCLKLSFVNNWYLTEPRSADVPQQKQRNGDTVIAERIFLCDLSVTQDLSIHIWSVNHHQSVQSREEDFLQFYILQMYTKAFWNLTRASAEFTDKQDDSAAELKSHIYCYEYVPVRVTSPQKKKKSSWLRVHGPERVKLFVKQTIALQPAFNLHSAKKWRKHGVFPKQPMSCTSLNSPPTSARQLALLLLFVASALVIFFFFLKYTYSPLPRA